MSKTLCAALALLVAGTSVATARPSTLNMTCAEAAATVAAYGAAVLSTGVHTYDRFVAHTGFCLPTEVAKPTTAPTLDTPYCSIGYVCEQRLRFRYDDN